MRKSYAEELRDMRKSTKRYYEEMNEWNRLRRQRARYERQLEAAADIVLNDLQC